MSTMEVSKSADPFALLRGWEPVIRPLHYVGQDGEPVLVESARAVVRSDTGAELGAVGPRYHQIPLRDRVALFESLGEAGRLSGLRSGLFDGGAKVWFQGEPLGGIGKVAGHEIRARLTLCDAHDGSLAMALVDSDVNIVCRNTFARAAKGTRGFRFRHTASIRERFDDAVMAIRANVEGFQASIENLAELDRKPMPFADFKALLDEFWPMPTSKEAKEAENVQEIRNRIAWANEAAPGARPGTRYGAYQSVTHWLTHERGRDGHRLASNWIGEAARLNKQVLSYLMN